MRAFKVTIDITNRYSCEIHAIDAQDAETQADRLTKHQIEDGGNFEKMVGVEVVDVEDLYPPDDEDEVVVQEAIADEEEDDDDQS